MYCPPFVPGFHRSRFRMHTARQSRVLVFWWCALLLIALYWWDGAGYLLQQECLRQPACQRAWQRNHP